MNVRISSIRRSAKAILLFMLFILGELLVGIATVFLPSYWITLALGLIVFLLVASYPMIGVSLMIASLYFPILPTVPLGPLEFSVSSLPVVGLALGIFFRSRFRAEHVYLAAWQKALLVILALAFLLSSLFSSDYPSTLKMMPNMLIYLVILFGIMAEINTFEKLKYVAKLILVLAFVLSIWRFELRPLRGVFDLPSLGINGATFSFHAGIALAFAILIFTTNNTFSLAWRWFAALTLLSLFIHGIEYQTRAAWLAWALMLILILSRVSWTRWIRFVPIVIVIGLITAVFYGSVIQDNYRQTSYTVTAAFGGNYSITSSDDRLRLLARDAGWRMFEARPVFGWGANRFDFLKPAFVEGTSKEADHPGAFDSWLIVLAEMGLFGLIASMMASLTPLISTWFLLRKRHTQITGLAFGFALGVFCLVIHLIFIDLLFSFYWIHVGLALAATRLALEKNQDVA